MQPEKSIDEWPTFPAPPAGTHGGARLLLGAGYLTAAAIYIASLLTAPSLREPVTWIALTFLFALFILSIYLYTRFFGSFWKRLAASLFQIALVFVTTLVSQGSGFVPILYFVVIPMAYLSLNFAQVSGLTTLLTLTLSVLGGCLMPTFIMPDFLQTISRFTPHAWAMQGFQDVLVRGYGLAGILPEAVVLLGFAAAFSLIGVWRFRFD